MEEIDDNTQFSSRGQHGGKNKLKPWRETGNDNVKQSIKILGLVIRDFYLKVWTFTPQSDQLLGS